MEGLREKFWKWKEAFESKGLKVNLRKRKVVVSGEASNGKFCVMSEMQEMDSWKMRERKEGDPEVGEIFCVWKMQEAS